MIRTVALCVVLLFSTLQLFAQEPLKPKPSPLDLRTYKFEDGTYIKVVYSRPHKRGRNIFGGLVPYGQVWRTGANQATEITFTQDVFFGDKSLPAGTYALFTIPNKDSWTILLNKGLGQWGAFEYNPELDVTSVQVPVMQAGEAYEPFTINFDPHQNYIDLTLIWDTTKVSVSIVPKETGK